MGEPDYKAMSVEELEAELLHLKAQKLAITDRQRELQAIRRDKLDLYYLSQRLGVDVAGLTPDEARGLLAIARKPREGDVVVTAETAVLTADTASAEVAS